jgi:predicted nucleotidyltransferase
METHGMPPPPRHQAVIDRFVAACRADARVAAAFLGGSYASGTADAYSDLDLGLIATDAAFEDFQAGREAFIRRLGEPVFLESFDRPDLAFVIFADGTDVELAIGRAGAFAHLHAGPYRVLLDEGGILAGVAFPRPAPGRAERRETARRQVYWFWHDLSHFIAALGRGQLWWAYGQLEELRRACVNMARVRRDAAAGADGYEKLELALPAETLAALAATLCPLERGAMLRAAHVLVRVYESLARPLARARRIPYPDGLARVMIDRLERLGPACESPGRGSAE